MSPTPSGSNAGIGGRTSGFISTGASATPQAVVDLLKKLDQQRKDRNAKRTKRKADGETDVSSDEEDETTPVLVIPAAGNARIALIVPAIVAPAARALIAPDAEAAKNLLDVSEGTIPKAIRALAQSGISPPLTLFVPEVLQRICSGLGTKSVKVTMELKDSVHLLDVSLFPDERNMDLATWFPCYNSFLKFIDEPYDIRIYGGFAQHFEFMISDPEFKDWFSAFRDFDIRLQAAYTKLLQSAKNRSLRAAPAPALPQPTAGPSRTNKANERDRVHPYGVQKKNSFRGISLCLRCGAIVQSTAKRRGPIATAASSSSMPINMGSFASAPMLRSASPLTSRANANSVEGNMPFTYAPFAEESILRSVALATDRERIVTPYRWETALRDCNLLHRYPNLAAHLLTSTSICARKFIQIEELIVPMPDRAAYDHLSTLPALRSLSVTQRTTPDLLPSLPFPPAGRTGFPVLRSLSTQSTTLAFVTEVVNGFPNTPLQSLNVVTDALDAEHIIRHFFAALLAHLVHSALEQITLKLDVQDRPSPYICQCVASRKILLDDTTVWDIARAWPNLVTLALTHLQDASQPIMTLASLRAFATHCPELPTLALTFDANIVPPSSDEQPLIQKKLYLCVSHFPLFLLRLWWAGSLQGCPNIEEIQSLDRSRLWKEVEVVVKRGGI
ncbi:hypothetical protein C8J57DRAFT_1588266 [Mycena rebaudengoi]|nr:hypothetical protein C8J57DRAFT_1588266 [Mycena rebaudengoi]